MKRQLTVALGLAVLATPAFATKARLQSLGEDIYGSFYIQDNRNIFYNAANVNNFKDNVTFEWGDTTADVDRANSPRAEGGFFKTAGNLVWGVQLGSESNSSNGFRAASGVGLDISTGALVATPVSEQNNIDLFIGGDMGVKWGANVTYSKSEDESSGSDVTQEALRTRFGVIAGDIEAWANINVSNKAEVDGAREFSGKLGYQVGAIYNFQDYRIFADYRSLTGEGKGDLAIGGGSLDEKTDIENSQLQIGVGKATRLNDRATLFTKVQYTQVNAENDLAKELNDFGGGGNVSAGGFGSTDIACTADETVYCAEYKSRRIPLTIGLEYEALNWLVVRSSISQNLWGVEEDADDERTISETTRVAAGLGLKFGDLMIDGAIDNNNYTRISAIYRF